MKTPTRSITKNEMLLAIAMSELYTTTHVLFIPPGTHYIGMLYALKRKAYVEPLGESYYKLTKKAWDYIKMHRKSKYSEADAKIDAFIAQL